MEVKDVAKRVQKDALSPIPLQQATRSRVPPSQVVEIKEVAAEVQVRSSSVPPAIAADVRKNLSDAIGSLSIASEATQSIAKYLTSIDGFIEQAQSADVSPQRQRALESEANHMVDEIKRTAREVSAVVTPPVGDDKVRREVEDKIGRTLDALIPEDRGAEIAAEPISFSRKESIIQTITNVAMARARLEEMRQSMQESSETLKNAVLSYEIALQNSEASQANVRDVDQAAKLVTETKSNIFKDPTTALHAVGNVVARSLELAK